MNAHFYSPLYGSITLQEGRPPHGGAVLLPGATVKWNEDHYGSILLQEVATEHWLLRYFIFRFVRPMQLVIREQEEGVQSLVSVKGMVSYGFRGRKMHLVNEGQFTLLQGEGAETQIFIASGRECHVLNTYYRPGSFADLLPLFPTLKQYLKKAAKQPRFFLSFPRPARSSVLDSIREILLERYQPELRRWYWEHKLRQSLFTQLAQTYTEVAGRPSTPLEKEKALAARRIIEEDLTRHYSNEDLAAMLDWSGSSLKRAFSQEYGMGMYEYLRRLRLQKGRELLLQGEQVKNVAPAVGMRPSNFTMEFQKFFGYKATSLRQVKGNG